MTLDNETTSTPGAEKETRVTSRILPDGSASRFEIDRDDPLTTIVNDTLEYAEEQLPAPRPEAPLDRLRNLGPHDAIGPVIDDLTTSVWRYLRQPHTTRNFGVELVRAIRVNKRWAIAPEEAMTPRAILGLFKLDPAEFSLYLPTDATPLPPDTNVVLSRGKAFEAQKDGKYGA